MITDNINQFPDLQGIKFPQVAERIDNGDLGREYRFKGIPGTFFSVTTVMDHIVPKQLKTWMQNNSANRQNKILKQTANIGSAIHEAIELDLQGLVPPLSEEIKGPFDQWLGLKDKHRIKAVYTEESVYNEFLGVAGSFDIIGEFEGQIALMDIKTGFFSKKAGWQMAAYKFMFEELLRMQNGTKVDLGMVGLQIHRDGRVSQPFVFEHTRFCLQRFLACLETFKGLYFRELEKSEWKALHNWSMDIL